MKGKELSKKSLPALRPHVVQLVTGIGHSRSNIAAIHFDGPWLDECLRLAIEVEKTAGDNRRVPWRGW